MRAAVEDDVRARPRERRPELPEHDAEALTAGGREALIRFNGQVYILRITRQGKLILTK